jgi:hypothetical protein
MAPCIGEIAAIRVVDVGPVRLGHTPGAHRAVRILCQCGLEGACRLGVVERVRLQQAAGEQLLRCGNGADDRRLQAAEAVEHRRARVAIGQEQRDARAQAKQGGRGRQGSDGERRATHDRLRQEVGPYRCQARALSTRQRGGENRSMKKVILRPGKERSLLRRHPWVFEGSVASGKADSGETVRIEGSDGRFLAWAAYSPQSSIRLRAWSFDEAERIDAAFFARRIAAALATRARLPIASDGVRLVHGESDGLPGLVVDR